MRKFYFSMAVLCCLAAQVGAQTVVEVSPTTSLSEAVAGKDVSNLKITGQFSQTDIGTLHHLAVERLDLSELKYVTAGGDPAADPSIRYYYDYDNQTGDWFAIQNDTELPACLCVGMTSLKEVILPEAAREIYRFVFDGCSNLATVQGLDRITRFHPGSLKGTALTEVTFATDLTLIEWQAFANCSKLTRLNNFENTHVTEIQDNAFLKCALEGTLTFPASIENIGNWAFGMDWDGWNDRLTDLDFSRCTNLWRIGACAFAHLNGIVSAMLPNTVSEIGGSAFNGCQALREVHIPENPGLLYINDSFVTQATGLTAIDIPANIEGIQHEAFADARLQTITFHGRQCPRFTDDNDGAQGYPEYAAGLSPFRSADPDECVVRFADGADDFDAAETYRASNFLYPYLTASLSEGDIPNVAKQYADVDDAEISLDEGWNVLVLPFTFRTDYLKTDLGADVIGCLESFDQETGAVSVAPFADEQIVEAGTPVLVYLTELPEAINLTNITLSDEGRVTPVTAAPYRVDGTLEWGEARNVYVPQGDTFTLQSYYETNGYHGWLVYDESLGIKGQPTAQQASARIFNLGGLQVAQPSKGVYVQGGKKYVY